MTDTVAISKDAISCDLVGELALLDIQSGVYYGLEGVGCVTWNFIQERRTVGEVVDYLMSRYSVDRAVCEAETAAFLEDLALRHLITLGDAITT